MELESKTGANSLVFFLVVFLVYMLLSFLILVFFVIIIIIIAIIILDQLAFTYEIILLNKANQRKTRTKNLGKKNNTTQKQPRKKAKYFCPLP